MSWTQTRPFRSLNILLSVPNKAGLYILRDSKNNIIYIGGSDDLKRRLNEHLNNRDNLCIRKNASQFEYALIDKWEELEQKFIEKYNPDCNRI